MTRGNLYFGWFSTDFWEESQRTEEFGILIVKSVTADGSLRSPTGSVEGIDLHLIFTNNLQYKNGYGWLRHCVHLYA